MKTKIGFAAALAATTAFAVPAMAQETTPDDYFNGLYISGGVSLDQLESDPADGIVFDTNGDGVFDDTVQTVTGADAFAPGFCNGNANSGLAADGCTDDDNDLGYFGRIGLDKRLGGGPIVVGALIEGAGSEARDFSTGFSGTPASYTISRKLDYSVAGRLRAGISPGDGRGLFYATGGVGYAKLDHGFATTNGANDFTPVDDDDWEFGWQAGGGAEFMLTRNISIGAEYLYNRYNDDDYSILVTQGTAPDTNPFLLDGGQTSIQPTEDKFGFHSFRATLGFHF
ncbi:outer membrane beta-barrel protein [Qipengyuania sp. JC766]|uniref:outer membrane protein n=1 Tax=Qipengyuania sp. JC766 TaxID=3232139 RepID=UPI00345A8B00